VIINATDKASVFTAEKAFKGFDIFNDSNDLTIKPGDKIEIPAFGYKVLSSTK
jgi:hypothetical protein